MPKKPVLSRAPLLDAHFAPLPLKAVTPRGQLAKRLKAASQWLSGLDWEDEQLGGLAALAILTGDTPLLDQAKARVERLLATQRTDGAFDPEKGLAAHAGLLRGMTAWYEATADKRVLVYLLRQLQYVFRQADKLFAELTDAALTGEYAYAALKLYGWTGKSFLLKLLEKLRALGLDWTGFFHTFPITRSFQKYISPEEMKKGLASADKETRTYYEKQRIMADGLALARGLKTPALLSRYSGSSKEKEAGKVGLEKVLRYHGTAHGLFAAEPSLMGGDPSCGMDGRAVAEAMFSLEQLLCAQGDAVFADAWEKIALNVLPAMEKNGRVHPIQRVNGPFPTENPPAAQLGPWVDAWLKGMTGYAAGLWMAAPGEGLALMGYTTSALRWKVNGTAISIQVEGNYPGNGEVAITLHMKKPVAFPLHLRIPAWAIDPCIQVNGEGGQSAQPGSFFVLDRTWQDGDRIGVSLPMEPRLTRWQHQSAAVEYGPLLMALSVDGEQPLWQVALSAQDRMTVLPSSSDEEEGVKIAAVFKKIPGWTAKGDRPQMPPIQPETQGEALTLHLTPYGETVCRMAQFPLAPED
jgi:DUF1680 family protein